MSISCIIIEDEPLASEKLAGFIKETDLVLCGCFTNAIDALAFTHRQAIDLIFLDIRMKKLGGLEFLRALSITPKIIITSAYSEYAIQGYDFKVTDYLLKPYSFERFLQAVEKVYGELPPASLPREEKSSGYIFIKTEYRIEKVNTSDILYAEGMNDYLRIVTSHKKIMTLQTFRGLAELLPQEGFYRVHKSFLVALSKIDSIERNRISIGEAIVPIGNSYSEGFYQLLKEKGVLK